MQHQLPETVRCISPLLYFVRMCDIIWVGDETSAEMLSAKIYRNFQKGIPPKPANTGLADQKFV